MSEKYTILYREDGSLTLINHEIHERTEIFDEESLTLENLLDILKIPYIIEYEDEEYEDEEYEDEEEEDEDEEYYNCY